MTFGNDRGTAAAPGAASVMAAMSGGVDSSVCALLLQQAGYDVRGATMVLRGGEVLGDAGKGEGSTCGSARDVEDARAVCRRLGIPHDAFNLRDRFDAAVVNPFCGAYLEGRTPNPCIACNRFLKFEALQKRRRQLGLDYVATGHYARRRWDEATGCWQLLRASDPAKDQSYVLYHLTQDTLAHMLFPLGELTKDETLRIQFREMSEELGLELDIEGCNRVRLEVLGRSTALVPHALEVVRELKKTHRVYLITNAVESVQRGRLGRSALAPLIEEAFISETAGAAKPSVEYFDYVFAHIDGITRENCLVIGDSLTSDIQGANNYGLACCWFNPKKAPKPESLRVDYEIRDLRELYDIVK